MIYNYFRLYGTIDFLNLICLICGTLHVVGFPHDHWSSTSEGWWHLWELVSGVWSYINFGDLGLRPMLIIICFVVVDINLVDRNVKMYSVSCKKWPSMNTVRLRRIHDRTMMQVPSYVIWEHHRSDTLNQRTSFKVVSIKALELTSTYGGFSQGLNCILRLRLFVSCHASNVL